MCVELVCRTAPLVGTVSQMRVQRYNKKVKSEKQAVKNYRFRCYFSLFCAQKHPLRAY